MGAILTEPHFLFLLHPPIPMLCTADSSSSRSETGNIIHTIEPSRFKLRLCFAIKSFVLSTLASGMLPCVHVWWLRLRVNAAIDPVISREVMEGRGEDDGQKHRSSLRYDDY